MKQKTNSKGITLTSLVVTIIIMLMLAGITIQTLRGEKGIIKMTSSSVENYERADEKEILRESYAAVYLNNELKDTGLTNDLLQKELESNNKVNKVVNDENDEEKFVVTFKKTGNVYYVHIPTGEVEYMGSYTDIYKDGDFAKSDIYFIHNKTYWTNTDVITTLDLSDYAKEQMLDYTLQWTKTPADRNSWKDYNGEDIVSEKNEVIYARIHNNIDLQTYAIASQNIGNIDKKDPGVVYETNGGHYVINAFDEVKENNYATIKTVVKVTDPKINNPVGVLADASQVYFPSLKYAWAEKGTTPTKWTTFESKEPITDGYKIEIVKDDCQNGKTYILWIQYNDNARNNENNEVLVAQSQSFIIGSVAETEITFPTVTWDAELANTATVQIKGDYSSHEYNLLQYQIDSTTGTWKTIKSGDKITIPGGLKSETHKTMVYARLYDRINARVASLQIKDNTAPGETTGVIELAKNTTDWSRSLTLTARVTDPESLITKWDWAQIATTERYGHGKGVRDTGNQTLKINKNGIYYFSAENGAELTNVKSIRIDYIDTTNPTVAFEPNAKNYVVHTDSGKATVKTKVTITDPKIKNAVGETVPGSGVYTPSFEYVWSKNNQSSPTLGWKKFGDEAENGKESFSAEIVKDDCEQGNTYYLWIRYNDIARQNSKETVLEKVSGAFTIGSTEETKITLAATWHETKANNATVTINGGYSQYKTEYQVNGVTGSWTEGNVVYNLKDGDKVYARLYDGINTHWAMISIIDNTAPGATPGVIELAKNTTEWRRSLTLTARVTDLQSMVTKWDWAQTATTSRYGTLDESGKTYTKGVRDTGNQTKTITANGTYYFSAEDGAGNTNVKNIVIENIDTVDPTVAFNPSTKNYVVDTDAGKATIKTTVTVTDPKIKNSAGTEVAGSGVYADSLKYAWSESNSTAPTSGWTKFTNGAEIKKTDCVYGKTYYLWIEYNDLSRHNSGTGVLRTKSGAFTIGSETNTKITFGDVVWSETTANTASVKVTGAYTGSKLQYQVNSLTGSWTDMTSGNSVTVTGGKANETGKTVIYARLYDGINSHYYATIEIKDTTAPVIADITKSTDDWVTSLTITSRATDSESLITKWDWAKTPTTSRTPTRDTGNQTKTITANGTYYFSAENGAGLTNVKSITIGNIDKLAPSSVTVASAPTTTKSITVNASATDATATTTDACSGIAGYSFSKDNGSTWTDYQTSATYKFDNLTSGTYNIKVKAKDKAGNETVMTTAKSVTTSRMDTRTVYLSASPTGWTNGDVTVTATAPAGVTVYYGVNTSTMDKTLTNGGTYTATGNCTIYYYGTDDVNKVGSTSSPKSITISNIDKLAPSSVTVASAPTTTKSITVNASATDAAKTTTNGCSGIAAYNFSNNNGESWTGYQASATYKFDNLTSGTYNIKVKAKDNAGNETVSTVKAVTTDKMDETTVYLAASPTGWTNGDVTVTATAPAGVTVYYGVNTSTMNKTLTNGGTYTATGNCTIYYYGTDGTNTVGTTSSPKSLTISNIDKTAPASFALSIPWESERQFIMYASFNDANSGLSTIKWHYKRPQDSSWQTETETYTAMNGTTAGTTGDTSGSKQIAVSPGGIINVWAEAWDVAGNHVTSYSESNPLEFETDKITTTYNANGGSVSPASVEQYYNLAVTLPTPSRAGHTFYGWYKSASGGDKIGNAGASYTVTTTRTLYAQWSDHSYTSAVTTAPTCTTNGVRTYTCPCGASYTEAITAPGHSYSSSYTEDVAATCTTAGSKSRHCTRCSAKTDVTTIPAPGHKYTSAVTTQPTCTTTGVRTYTCSVCKHSYPETIAALDHDYSSNYTVDVEATCTSVGWKSRHCTRCSSTTGSTQIPAMGHYYNGGWTTSTAATCTTAGSQYRYCARNCGTKETSSIPATGHSYSTTYSYASSNGITNGERYFACLNGCGSKSSVAYKLNASNGGNISGIGPGNGDSSIVDGGYYAAGKTISLRATANTGYNFSYWAIHNGGTTTANPYNFSMPSNAVSVTAYAVDNIAPTNVKLKAVHDSVKGVTLTPSATDEGSGIKEYVIYEGTTVIDTIQPNLAASIWIEDVLFGTHNYHVVAYDNSNNSKKSDPITYNHSKVNGEDDLIAFRDGISSYQSWDVTQVANVTCSTTWTKGIGTTNTPFKGTYNGGSKYIKDLSISASGTNNIGLFGKIQGGTVKDLTLKNSVIEGNKYTGAIVGHNTGTLSNITLDSVAVVGNSQYTGGVAAYITYTGSISDITVKNTDIYGNACSGGVVGECETNISTVTLQTVLVSGTSYVGGCSGANGNGDGATGTTISGVTAKDINIVSDYYCGGILGFGAYVTINNCSTDSSSEVSATGADTNGFSKVGGIVGVITEGASSVKNCTNAGTITGAGAFVGGVIGHAAADDNTVLHNIEYCANQGSVTGQSFSVAGIVGRVGTSATIKNCDNTGNIKGTYEVGGIGGRIGHVDDSDGVTINYCYNKGTITSTGTLSETAMCETGGITGVLQKGNYLKYCYNVGKIKNTDSANKPGGLGGITGGMNVGATVWFCYNGSTGSITRQGEYTYYCGAIIGVVINTEDGKIIASPTVANLGGSTYYKYCYNYKSNNLPQLIGGKGSGKGYNDTAKNATWTTANLVTELNNKAGYTVYQAGTSYPVLTYNPE